MTYWKFFEILPCSLKQFNSELNSFICVNLATLIMMKTTINSAMPICLLKIESVSFITKEKTQLRKRKVKAEKAKTNK